MPRFSTRTTAVPYVVLAIAIAHLIGRPAWAEIFVIPDGEVSALVAAIQAANTNGEHDIVELAADGTYIVDTISSSLGGGSAFPLIEPDGGHSVEIRGRGATILRDPSADPMRFFFVLDGSYLEITDVVLVGGLLEDFEGGGAVRVHPAGTVWIKRSVLKENKSPWGSAIHGSGVVRIIDSELEENVSDTSTATVVTTDLYMQGSTLRNNGENGEEEGAILALGPLTLINTTIAHNEGYGVYIPDNSGGTLVSSTTIFGNTGTGLIVHSSESLVAGLYNTVVAENSQNCDTTAPLFGAANVAEDDSCPLDGGFTTVDEVLLSPLADNGGAALPGGNSPWTMMPLDSSPLVDTGDGNECLNYYLDQRGKPRSVDGDADGTAVCDVGAVEFQLFKPARMEVDYTIAGSDGNGVFEPGEDVTIAPAWRFESGPVEEQLGGHLVALLGPEGANYFPMDGAANYGVPLPGESTSCRDANPEDCYVVSAQPDDGRPVQHWDIVAVEDVFNPDPQPASRHEWTLHIGDSFVDVLRTNPFYRFVETMLHHEVTTGCSATDYCPAASTSRRQMPMFVLRALEGANYSPTACEAGSETYSDVPASSPFCPWIEELAARGVIAGCGGGAYCPAAPVSRAQMAVFALRTLEGGAYEPPQCESGSEMFDDVPAASTFCHWIEELARRQVVAGCGAGNYCPSTPVTRGQMSVFLSKTFSLSLYGP